ncbi:MAG: hypothetical protein AAF628_18365 [Planctomycetota bacterium]
MRVLVLLFAGLLGLSGGVASQCHVHTPAYPANLANRAPRLTPETALLIRAQYASANTTWPDQAEATQLIGYVDQLAKNNAYNAPGYGINFLTNGTVPYFDVALALPGPVAGPAHLLRILREFDAQYPTVPIDQCDHVVVFRPQDQQRPVSPSNAAGYITYPQNFEPRAPSADPMREAAAGVFHEMGHKYSLGHANLQREPSRRRINYGDVYDYMGGMSPFQWRFDESLWPIAPPAPVFADPLDIHANPIVKWMHSWLGSASITRDTTQGTTQYDIAGLSQPTGLRAVEIPRQDLPNVPYSLLVYWRDNEPQMADGACVAIVSRENIRATTRLVELNPGPTIPGPASFPGFAPTLLPAASWTDPVSGVTITCNGLSPAGDAMSVTVNRPSNFDFMGLAYLDIVAPALDNLHVQTNSDTFCVSVHAAAIDVKPEVPFAGIDRVEAQLRVGEGAAARVLRVGSATGPEARYTFYDAAEFWTVNVANLVDPIMASSPVQAAAAVRVTAYTHTSKRTVGQKTLLIDQTR